ncbi:hypothetical protein D5086_004957 [Populus alba]|uniref:Uncharacterized protein n=1 Tax=Populus alba TaxID=43335 RepID=A0ACC4CT31_POPAL
MSNLKLGVEVVGAHDLMAKDGQGSANAFVELHFDQQKFRTTIKDKDLSPVWNENFYFNISDPSSLSNLTLEAHVYHRKREKNSKSSLGKVRLTGTSFVPYSDAIVLHYPLEKQGILSRVKGELGLKVFVTNDPSIRSSNPLPAMESSLFSDFRATQAQAPEQQTPKVAQKVFSDGKSESRHTFHHLPNPSQSQKQQHAPQAATQPSVDYGIREMKSEPQAPRVVRMFPGLSAQPVDYTPKETSPFLGGGQVVGGRVIRGDRPASTYDLVEQMKYLFVRIVKARDLPTMDVTGSLDPYVEDKDLIKDDFVGIVRFDLHEVPTRVPPDSPLASECRWFGLEKSVSASMDEHQSKKDKFSSRLHLRVVLDGGPLTVMQQDMLRFQAVNLVAARLGRAEPPLRKEVVEYMSDADSHLWSMRRSKANFFRLMSVFSGLLSVGKWFGEVCMWKNPITTVLVQVLFVMLVCFPELILPTVFLYMFLIGVWNYHFRPRYPPHMNTRISYADAVSPDELDEEFDTFPSRVSPELVRFRYDRLRSVAGRIQTVVGDMATQGERVQALLSWRDPRATTIFLIFCLVVAIVLYATPFQVLALLGGFYFMRHPRFRHRVPSAPVNFFRRLPARTDSML